jgi:hypothetical protein
VSNLNRTTGQDSCRSTVQVNCRSIINDLNIEDEQVSNVINRTITETIENLDKSHTGTIEEEQSFDMVKKEISNKKKKLKPSFTP